MDSTASATTACLPAAPARTARPRTARGRTSRHERSIGGTRQLPSAMPMLRRPHDRHRGVRRVEAVARTAESIGTGPGELSMTRHGMVQPSAAGTQPPATDRRASMEIIEADSRAEPPTVPTTPRGGATKRSVRIKPAASRRRSRHRRHLPKIEIPIAIAYGPRVPSSGTFVHGVIAE